ncbi:hypothetical protein [Amedibacterium intestinale]|uniref:hypothetical protein n=1 Tax=Amedibacterium intestinale TaxID=2583452 RepID=UPI000E2086B0
MGFAQGEVQAMFRLFSILLLFGEIPLYLIAVNKIKEHNSCTGYKAILLLMQGIVIISYMDVIQSNSIMISILFAAMFFLLPVVILSFLKNFLEKRSITMYMIYLGIFQIVFLLLLFVGFESTM